jgi:hypothetical protein
MAIQKAFVFLIHKSCLMREDGWLSIKRRLGSIDSILGITEAN